MQIVPRRHAQCRSAVAGNDDKSAETDKELKTREEGPNTKSPERDERGSLAPSQL